MNLLQITFEIRSPLARFQVMNEITRYECMQLTATSFVMKTEEENGAVFRRMQGFLGDEDSVYVTTLQPHYSGAGLKSVIDWLDDRCAERLPQPRPVMPLPRVMNLAG